MFSFLFSSGCDEFTVDLCNPDPSQMINTVSIPNDGEQTEICQDLCDKQADCAYWSIFCPPNSAEPCPCTFYASSYLHSCQKVGGDEDTDIEVILISKLKLGRKSKVVIPFKNEKSFFQHKRRSKKRFFWKVFPNV